MRSIGRSLRKSLTASRNAGFILIMVVGALAVLIILGMSFAEQSRTDLLGASNARDLGAVESLGETGFEIAKSLLYHDRSVDSVANPKSTPGFTGRWGYNPYVDTDVTATGLGVRVPNGPAPNLSGGAPSRSDPANYLNSWQTMLWNEDKIGTNAPLVFDFQFDILAVPAASSQYNQRMPVDPTILFDTWNLQPLARVKKFRVKAGNSYGLVQVSISPRDGGINVNDVFDPNRRNNFGAAAERAGWHSSNIGTGIGAYAGPLAPASIDRYAAPDRRTLEYVLGKRPEFANRQWDMESFSSPTTGNVNGALSSIRHGSVPGIAWDKNQFVANQPSGSVYNDNGVYNYRALYEPSGRSTLRDTVANAIPSYEAAWMGIHRSYSRTNKLEPMLFYNAHPTSPNRYNYEGARYVLFNNTSPLSSRLYTIDNGTHKWYIADWNVSMFYPSGRYKHWPVYPAPQNVLPGNYSSQQRDLLFNGFGFDLIDPRRGGVAPLTANIFATEAFRSGNAGVRSVAHYVGAGVYGHPSPRTFQGHFVASVAGGRFWTDLMAAWYFGGAPGYTTRMGEVGGRGNTIGNLAPSTWVPLGSSYDSLGIGSHWHVPSSHIWNAGYFGAGALHPAEDIARGLVRYSRAMPPAKPAATYVYPLVNQTQDERGGISPHFSYSNNRIGLRACGIQENWGTPTDVNDPNGRFYDAININVANYQVVYGLLTPEKFPSMLARTVVAPHLHWKARMLDAAYQSMTTYKRYDPNQSNGEALWPYGPDPTTAALELPTLGLNLYGIRGPMSNPSSAAAFNVLPYNPVAQTQPRMDPIDYRYSLHRNKQNFGGEEPGDSGPGSPFADPVRASAQARIWGKMDFVTPEPLAYREKVGPPVVREGSGQPADDVFCDVQHDLTLNPNDMDVTSDLGDHASATTGFRPGSTMAPRPDNVNNWSDWFMQRVTKIGKYKMAAPPWGGATMQPAPVPPGTPPDPTRDSPYFDSVFQIGFQPITNEGFRDNAGLPMSNPPWNSGYVLPNPAVATVAGVTEPIIPPTRRARPHPIYGLCNPNYLLMNPGSPVNLFWSDQFRRYFPIDAPPATGEVANGAFGAPCAPSPEYKMVDVETEEMTNQPAAPVIPPAPAPPPPSPNEFGKKVHPASPVTKWRNVVPPVGNPPPFVPAINRDEAWRLTRVGRKYQEIIADEIMDYQINPWWPNPSAPHSVSGGLGISVPLDLTCAPSSDARLKGYEGVANGNFENALDWQSMWEARHDPAGERIGLTVHLPDYYMYFNRFWCRPAMKYNRGGVHSTHFYNPTRGENPVANRGVYPRVYQYFGQTITPRPGGTSFTTADHRDRVTDFPENTLEDQSGSDWRYLSATPFFMGENQIPHAPARNHPFRHWADFVAMLGHLVYRSPMPPLQRYGVGATLDFTNATTVHTYFKDEWSKGVDARIVCHGAGADPRNKQGGGNKFFDGSTITDADSLRGFTPGQWGIVAREYHWPLCANYGEYYSFASNAPAAYPDPAAPFTNADIHEWRRRVDENRGRDAAGLRVEHHYISERAANDVLVSLSNGRVGPIDFDGDGIVTMTRKNELPYVEYGTVAGNGNLPLLPKDAKGNDRNMYWEGYPWHEDFGATTDPIVKYIDPSTGNGDYLNRNSLGFGIKRSTTADALPVRKNEIIQDCVTLPIKFRSNTFRVTVSVELTDSAYKNVYATRRFSRVYSRIPGRPGDPMTDIKVNGQYGGEFILHSNRAINGVDPESAWLGIE